jgi:hypothetical protein
LKLDLTMYRTTAGVGRDLLEHNIGILCDALEIAQGQAERAERDLAEAYANLTATQLRCTQLLGENRQLRGVLDPTA